MTIPLNINSRILLSGAAILAAAALIIGATLAFFSDTETSEGNILQAGGLDLKIDSEAHYAGLVCEEDEGNDGPNFIWVDDNPSSTTRPDLVDKECSGTWEETDLGPEHKFFDLSDIKPGDEGEVTVSLHVFDNDAWGRLVINDILDEDNGCTEPESEDAGDVTCNGDPDGELQENLLFRIWLDEGLINGFQCSSPEREARCEADPEEGDNIWQETTIVNQQSVPAEPQLVAPGTLDEGGEILNIWQGLQVAYGLQGCVGSGDPDDRTTTCIGLTPDGHMIGSVTYYFGLAWELPDDVEDIVQTDSLQADMRFEIEQHRNNPGPPFQ